MNSYARKVSTKHSRREGARGRAHLDARVQVGHVALLGEDAEELLGLLDHHRQEGRDARRS